MISAARITAAIADSWTRLSTSAASITSSALNAARRCIGAIWSRRALILASALFLLIATVVPIEAVAIPGYFVCWFGCLLASWFLTRGEW